MKLLLDENLSPRLVALLSDIYPASQHVHDLGLGSSDDDTIWEYAKANGYTIVSKDSDFSERSVLLGSPPKLIWVRAGIAQPAKSSGCCGTLSPRLGISSNWRKKPA